MIAADCAVVILASGLSQRFGEGDKLQALLCDKPVLDHVVDTVSEVGFGQIYLVTTEAAHPTRPRITNILNLNPDAGQGFALGLGLRRVLSDGWGEGCVCLGDMPAVSVVNFVNLLDKITVNQSVVSECKSMRLPPVIFTRADMELIISHNPPLRGRKLFDRTHPLTVSISTLAAMDIDTPADLDRVEAMMRATPS